MKTSGSRTAMNFKAAWQNENQAFAVIKSFGRRRRFRRPYGWQKDDCQGKRTSTPRHDMIRESYHLAVNTEPLSTTCHLASSTHSWPAWKSSVFHFDPCYLWILAHIASGRTDVFTNQTGGDMDTLSISHQVKQRARCTNAADIS
jgi:hypothetical protein